MVDEPTTLGLSLLPVGSGPPTDLAAPDEEPGAMLGRYVVVGQLGQGGMGVVARAYDSRLRREVALKRLRLDRATPEGRARLLREAQAMAQLAHPNVVAVFDVEDLGRELVLAMEYVDGTTLREWLAAGGHALDETLDVLRQAGGGLHAAHLAGLVHRDFKPANVLVGNDGRVRVTDFGIARGRDGHVSEPKPGAVADAGDDSLSNPLTREGTVVGTPPYMSPEQHRGDPADARSDQFAFGVTMWEALWGERPFVGRAAEQLQAKRRGPPRPPDGGVPKHVAEVVRRALAPAAGDRFADMAELLGALDRGRARARRRRALAGIGAAGLVVVAVIGFDRFRAVQRVRACEAEGAAMATVWPGADGAARARVRAGLIAVDPASGEVALGKLVPWLDDHAAELAATRIDACVRLDVRADGAGERARECLDEHAAVLGTLVEELSTADRQLLFGAVSAAAGLPDARACADEAALARRPSSTAALRGDAAAVRAGLSRAHAYELAGRYALGLREAEPALTRAETTGLPWLVAEARARVGVLHEQAGDFDRAERELVAAYLEAAKVGATETAQTAATNLVFTVGYRRARHAEGLLWASLADVELTRLGQSDSLRAAAQVSHAAVVHYAAGEYAPALAAFERALTIREDTLGGEHPVVATSVMNIGNVRYAMGEYDAARGLYERALAIRERSLGLDHPDVAQLTMNLGAVLTAQGHYGEARSLFERAIAIQEGSVGPDHPDVASTLGNLASVHLLMHEPDPARKLLERSIAIVEKTLGPDHPDLATASSNLGNIHAAAEQWDEARALYRRAIDIYEKALGPDHPDLALTLGNLAGVEKNVGAYAQARAHFERSLAIREKVLGPDHPDVGFALVGLGEVELLDGRSDRACELLGRGVSIREAGAAPPEDLAHARSLLERALRAAKRGGAREHD